MSLGSLLPALAWLPPRYDRRWLGKDVLGGLAAGAVVVPQAMAYATIADLPVEVGLVLDELHELERELAARDVTLWIAAMPPHTLTTARRAPRWGEFEAAGRLFSTALAAVTAYRTR